MDSNAHNVKDLADDAELLRYMSLLSPFALDSHPDAVSAVVKSFALAERTRSSELGADPVF